MHSSGHNSFPMVIVSILLTALCWGSYGPLLQWGHMAMESGRLRPFICVGIAYFIIAIVGPIAVMLATGMELGDGILSGWTGGRGMGLMWSLLGGAAGAVGAFGIILALNYGGHPTFVMPLVFGCAPVVNTMITIGTKNKWGEVSPFFLAGLILVATGAVTVLVSAPKMGPPPKPTVKHEGDAKPAKPADAKSDTPAVDAPKKND